MDSSRTKIFFYIILLFILLNLSRAQICNKNVTQSRIVYKRQTYTTFKKFGSENKTVILSRPVSQVEITWKNVKVCCRGYSLKRGKCTPICDHFCENSKCVAPNKCECLPGYKQFNQYRCLPFCDHCKFGLCSGPNICDCYSGYENDGIGSCKPKCSKPCLNGECTQPDICTCNPGYEKAEGSSNECLPKCTMPCINGICSEPEQCSCNTGYYKDIGGDPFHCWPSCRNNCTNGDCILPDVCICKSGYELNEKSGVCDMLPSTTTSTIKTTVVTRSIINPSKTAVYHESIEESPPHFTDYSEDYPGPQKDSENAISGIPLQATIHSVRPADPSEVPNHWIRPVTIHNENFSWIMINRRHQGSVTQKNIPATTSRTYFSTQHNKNSKFTSTMPSFSSPNMNKNQKLIQEDINYNIYPVSPEINECDPVCIGGNCTNGICICYEGYVQVDINECTSKCENSCQNGKCNENGVCQCFKGFDLNSNNECIPVCMIDCINGYCIEPNLCECHEGYILDESLHKNNRCLPICNNDDENGCINGTCMAPNVCKCNEGFSLSQENKFLCIINSYIVPTRELSYNYTLYLHESKLGVYAFYLAVILFIGFAIVLMHYYTVRKMGKKDYHVGYNEGRYGTVAFSMEKNNIFIA